MEFNRFRAKSTVSKRTGGSQRSSKTYVSVLEQQLKEEKRAREVLEREIQEMKKTNSEIYKHLGLQPTTQTNLTKA